MNINTLTLDNSHPYKIGENYFIRTVTHIYTGKLMAVFDMELVLKDAAWVADTGRFADTLKDYKHLEEVEPYPDGEVVIGRGTIVDAHPNSQKLPRDQK